MISTQHAQKWIFYTALLFAISLPLSRAGISIFGGLLFVIWLLEGKFKEKFQTIIGHKFTLALLIFLLYTLIVYLWIEPQNFKLATNYNSKYIYFLLIFALFTSYPKEKVQLLLYAFLIGIFLSSLESLSIYFDIYKFKEVNENSLSPHMWHTIYDVVTLIKTKNRRYS